MNAVIIQDAVVGTGAPRASFEEVLEPVSAVGLPATYARLHLAPALLGIESPLGIGYGPHVVVNLRMQEHGVEGRTQTLYQSPSRLAGSQILFWGRAEYHTNSPFPYLLSKVSYKVKARFPGVSQPAVLFEAWIDIGSNPSAPTARAHIANVDAEALRKLDPVIARRWVG
jgi:hypothetical protein